MKNRILPFFLLLTRLTTFGQIIMEDSTVQVISYWDKGEKQSYSVTTEKIKITGSDTTSKEVTAYEVEMTVLDSSVNSYTVEWLYKYINPNDRNPRSPY